MSDNPQTRSSWPLLTWLAWLLIACTVSFSIKGFVGWKLGSPELLAVVGSVLFLFIAGQRMLKFRGTWRITGLLLFTCVVALAAQFLLVPYNALQRQKQAIQRITEKGGRVSIAGAGQIPIENVYGWAQTNDGWMVPTFLLRWWHRHLGLGYVYELDIPASLVTRDVLKDLQAKTVYRMRILLDGTKQIEPNFRDFFPGLGASDRYPWLVFQSLHDADPFQGTSGSYLSDNDIQLLNSIKGGRIWIELINPEPMQRLRQLDKPFNLSIELGNAPVSSSLARIIEESPNLENLRLAGMAASNWQPLFDAVNNRKHPIDLIFFGNNDLTMNEWQSFTTLKNIRSLDGCDRNSIQIIETSTPGKARLIQGADLDLLEMPDLERMTLWNIDRLPSSYRSPKLRSIFANNVPDLQIDHLRSMLESSVREVEVHTDVVSHEPILQSESWMADFQKLIINGQTFR